MLRERLLEEFLAWTVAMGADEAVGDIGLDRFAESERRARALAAGRAAPARSAAPAAAKPAAPFDGGLGATIAAARAAAAAADSLAALKDAVMAFDGCALRKTATNTVFADGVPSGGLMLIGEAPGADEDRIGRPFVGVSGQLLDRMLAAIGRSRQTDTYITNTLFWRPPGNRKPTDSEIALCRPFVERHIALVRPRLLVLVGGTASAAMLPGSPGITRLRGQWLTLEVSGLPGPVQAIAMYHPSFLLRSPERKREAWADLLSIKSRLEEPTK